MAGNNNVRKAPTTAELTEALNKRPLSFLCPVV